MSSQSCSTRRGRPFVGSIIAAARRSDQPRASVGLQCRLRTIRVEHRREHNFETPLLANLDGLMANIELGFKEHDRLLLARQMLERRLAGRCATTNLPGLIELVLASPLVSTGMIASELDITASVALCLVEELNLREMTGRGRQLELLKVRNMNMVMRHMKLSEK